MSIGKNGRGSIPLTGDPVDKENTGRGLNPGTDNRAGQGGKILNITNLIDHTHSEGEWYHNIIEDEYCDVLRNLRRDDTSAFYNIISSIEDVQQVCSIDDVFGELSLTIGSIDPEPLAIANSYVFKISQPKLHNRPIVIKVNAIDRRFPENRDYLALYTGSLNYHYRLHNANHPNLRNMSVPIYSTHYAKCADYHLIITEFLYIEKTLDKVLGTCYYDDEGLQLRHVSDLLEFVNLVNANLGRRTFHSDIKPENIFIDNGNRLLFSDFEEARGTHPYIIPAVLRCEGHRFCIDGNLAQSLSITKHDNDLFAAKMVAMEILCNYNYNQHLKDEYNNDLNAYINHLQGNIPIPASRAGIQEYVDSIMRLRREEIICLNNRGD